MKKILLLVLLGFLNFNLTYSQKIDFPIQGSYRVVLENKSNFDIIEINENKLVLYSNKQIVDSYIILSENNSEYLVEQFFDGDQTVKRDKKRYTIKIIEKSGNRIKVRFTKGSLIQELELFKN